MALKVNGHSALSTSKVSTSLRTSKPLPKRLTSAPTATAARRNENCNLCPLHQEATSVCVWGEQVPKLLGLEQSQNNVMVIGEAPGYEEDKRNRPFIGKSGKLLREELESAGIKNYYLTNPVKCRPPNNRKPTPAEIKACRPYLDAEIAQVKPKWVVTAGNVPSKLLLKESKITQCHGKIIPKETYTGMPIYHPAYVLRDPGNLIAFRHDLAKLKRALDGEVGQETDAFRWKLITYDNFHLFIDAFKKSPEFSYDTETNGLFIQKADFIVRSLAIGLEGCTWVLPLQMPGTALLDIPNQQKAFVELFVTLAEGKIAIAQNGKFDNNCLQRCYGVKFHLDFDTMLAHHLLDENQDHDLKYMARVELDCPEYDLTKKEKENPDLSTPAAREKYWAYNARDAWNTLYLKRKFASRLRKDRRLRRLYYQLVMPAARAMEDIEMEGLTLDLEKYKEVEHDIRIKHRTALRTLNNMAGQEINWNSPQQIGQLLFGKLKLSVTVKTPTGAPSTGELALVNLKGRHPIIEQILKYRELEKFLSSYIEGWKSYIVEGKLYLGYKVHGTTTGRYASRLHQVPRDGTLRNIFIAPPGWKFIQADLSQAELRIAAELSGDLELVACFRPNGPDVHWRTALHTIGSGATGKYNELAIKTATTIAWLSQRPDLSTALEILRNAGPERAAQVDKIWKEARYQAKPCNFGFVFGMYENTFIEQCKTEYGFEPTWDEAHAFRQAYFELYQGIPKWHEKQKTLVRLDEQVTNLFGRVRRLPGIRSSDRDLRGEAERQAINSPVQGTIGDWKAAALIEIHQTLPHDKLRIVGEHHDALLMICQEGCEDEMLPQVRAIMKKPKLLDTFKIKMAVLMDCEIAMGPWGAGATYRDPT